MTNNVCMYVYQKFTEFVCLQFGETSAHLACCSLPGRCGIVRVMFDSFLLLTMENYLKSVRTRYQTKAAL